MIRLHHVGLGATVKAFQVMATVGVPMGVNIGTITRVQAPHHMPKKETFLGLLRTKKAMHQTVKRGA